MKAMKTNLKRREFLAGSLKYSAQAVCASWALTWATACTKNGQETAPAPATDQPATPPADTGAAAPQGQQMSPEKAKEILENSEVANSLNYVEQAEESEAREGIAGGETRYCCNCQFFAQPQGLQGGNCPKPDARAACQIIPPAPVRAAGYCTSWVAVQS